MILGDALSYVRAHEEQDGMKREINIRQARSAYSEQSQIIYQSLLEEQELVQKGIGDQFYEMRVT